MKTSSQPARTSLKKFSRAVFYVALGVSLSLKAQQAVNSASCPYIFGTLGGDPPRAVPQYNAGIKLITLGLVWVGYEPQDGVYSTDYIENYARSRLRAFQAAGLSVVLNFGFEYPPQWIFQYAHSRYKNQYGDTSVENEIGYNGVNAVFNQAMRDKQERYLARVLKDLGVTNFFAVELGGGRYGELCYPFSNYNNHHNCYWAFDDIAQGKTAGLPPGMTPCPVPGWVPGTPSANHTSASQFINWYLDSIKNYHDWQITKLRKYYGGRAAMLYPGWGIRPGDLETAIAVDLNGTTGVETLERLQFGGDFKRFVSGMTDANIYVYTTWLDAPGNDSSSDPAAWTPVHYLASLAQANPVNPPLWGENAGVEKEPASSYAAMQRSFAQMAAYRLLGFNWSIGDHLYDGAHATLSQYANLIAKYCTLPQPGTFFLDFNSNPPAALSFVRDAKWVPSGGVGGSGYVSLTDATGDQKGTIHLPDLNSGTAIEGFLATFQLRIGGGARPADGFSFNFADNISTNDVVIEEGVQSGLTISFDTWDNGGSDTAPAIEVKVDGQVVATAFMAAIGGLARDSDRAAGGPTFKNPATGQDFDMRTGANFAPVRIEWRNGRLNLNYKGADIFQNLSLPLAPRAGHFVLGARTGGATDNHWVDDLSITTVPQRPSPEPNRAPLLAAIEGKTISEGSELTVICSAADRDLPAQTLTFTLDAGAPTGAAINPATGVFTWTPSEAQGPGNYTVTVRVTDNGSPPLSASRAFTVNVAEVNSPPLLAAIQDSTVDELRELAFTAAASDPDLPRNTLNFSLDPGAPKGASITPAGMFSWTPTEAQGPGTYPITVRVMDNGSPQMSDAKTFRVTVDEVNIAPVLAPIPDQVIDETSTLRFTAIATDPDVPSNTLAFSLGPGAPPGASVDSTTGVFIWTPTEAQGPSTNVIAVIVADNGSPPLSVTNTFIAVVNEVNQAPILAAITDKTANSGAPLTFIVTATDPDLPPNSLTYSLEAGAPQGAKIDPASGWFSWTPTAAQEGTTNQITVRVTDNAVPPLADTKSFLVVVPAQGNVEVRLSAMILPDGSIRLVWTASKGGIYVLQRSVDLINWEEVETIRSTSASVEYVDARTPLTARRFYRVVQR